MDNFTRIKTKKLFSLTVIFFSAVLLQACGGQRDEPFNASSSSSSAAAIEINNLKSAEGPIGAVDYNSKLLVIRDTAKFSTYWQLYTNTSADSTVDFGVGQVILIDAGRKTACDVKSAVKNVSAYKYSGDMVHIIVDYMKTTTTPQSSSSSSRSSSSVSSTSGTSSSSSSSATTTTTTCGNANTVQNYYFYYVKSRNEIFFDENGNK